jgi:hypothetical protein
MDEVKSRPFLELFDLRSPGTGLDVNWAFGEPDLNVSARWMLAHLDQVFGVAEEPGWIFLTTIENDAEAGRFPEVLRNFFAGEFWSTRVRYFVAPMAHSLAEPEHVVGRLTFETRPGQIVQLLSYLRGFAWGTDLSVGGIQVQERDVAEALVLNPFRAADAGRLNSISRLAWAASRDLDRLGLNLSPEHAEVLEKLGQLRRERQLAIRHLRTVQNIE